MWRNGTGRGVRVAVVDSGIHAAHPHVGPISDGASMLDDGVDDDTIDRIGHGTAVAAAIRERAPRVELYAVKVFGRTLSTTTERLVRGVVWAADAGAHIINLSLGTARAEQAGRLAPVIDYARRRGSTIVAAEESEGTRWFPGSLPGVVPVRLDWSCRRDECRIERDGDRPRFRASGYARPIPGVPLEANLKGISFAVAAVSGFIAGEFGAETGRFPPELDTIVKHFTESRCAGARSPRHVDMPVRGV